MRDNAGDNADADAEDGQDSGAGCGRDGGGRKRKSAARDTADNADAPRAKSGQTRREQRRRGGETPQAVGGGRGGELTVETTFNPHEIGDI